MPSYTRFQRTHTDAEIAALYQELRDSEKVAFQTNISPANVLIIVRKLGLGHLIPRRGHGSKGARKPLAITDAEIGRRYRAGENGPELAEAAGCSTKTIYELLDSQGIQRRSPGGARPKPARALHHG